MRLMGMADKIANFARNRYTAVFDWVETGYWEVGLAEDPRVRAYGSTIEEARANLCTVMGVVVGVEHGLRESGLQIFEFVDEVRLSGQIRSSVELACGEEEAVRQLGGVARIAREHLASSMAEAVAATRKASQLLAEHAAIVEADASTDSPTHDLQLPQSVLDAIASAGTILAQVGHARAGVVSSQEAVSAAKRRALATCYRAVRVLVYECNLTVVEAGSLLGLSGDRVERLLSASGAGVPLGSDRDLE